MCFEKRGELLENFKAEGSNINPLVLIQLPDKREGLLDNKDEVIQSLAANFGVTEENGKLAIWLSDEKSDILPNIEKNDNEIEVLIFKQAIAVGWDCPRAMILVLFREWKSITFSIQTVGRIMRMPEFHYYKKTELNKGYVFTNLANIAIAEDIARDYFSTYESKRDDFLYTPIQLTSVHLKRQRERTRLSRQFTPCFFQAAKEFDLKNKITTKDSPLLREIMIDGKIIDIDKVVKDVKHDGTIGIQQMETEVYKAFILFIRSVCSPFAPVDSMGCMRTAIYKYFEKELGINNYYRIQKIILSKENNQAFIGIISKAKDYYKQEMIAKLKETKDIEFYDWAIPEKLNYSNKYSEKNCQSSIMKPFFRNSRSRIEENFIDVVNDSSNVEWWFRNGESDRQFFAVLRTDGAAFYPDFIVKFKNGSIGIFDTKGGQTASNAEAGPRAEGLQKYISEENKKGKSLLGGIVIYKDNCWRINNNEKYSYNEKDVSSWNILEL